MAPNTVAVWRMQALLSAVMAAVVGVVACAVTHAAAGPWLTGLSTLAGGALGLVVLMALLAAAWWLPQLAYRHLGYRLDDHGLVIRRGVFWRHRIAIPRVRIQHSDVSQGPLQRRYGVATLKLYTAGSRFTCNELPGLDHPTALALRDTLLRREGGGDGDAV